MPKYVELSANVELNTQELLGNKPKEPDQEEQSDE